MALESRKIWLDGELVPWEAAQVHVLSQSVQRGSLVFDVMSCHALPEGPAVFGLEAHVQRFQRSAALSGMELPRDLAGILEGVSGAVHANPGAEIVKLSAYYPGVSLDVLPREPVATLAIAAFSVADLYGPGAAVRPERPARLTIPDPRKMPPWVMSPQAKLAAGYLYTSVAKAEARRNGFDDVLLLDENGNLAESSTMSFCLVDGGELFTASGDTVLESITRRVVLELARDEGVVVHEVSVPRERLGSAAEAFVCGTSANVWPVERIDDLRLPDPVPGAVTGRLKERIETLLAGGDPVFSPKWMQPV